MDSYWTHYAQVMEFNRQRMALQNASNSVSFYDIPSRQVTVPYSRIESFNRNVSNLSNSSLRNNFSRRRRRNHRRRNTPMSNQPEDLGYEGLELELEEDVNESSCSMEFVVDDGFIKFLEISMEHKLKRKKLLEAEKQREKLREEEEKSKGTNLMGVKHKQRKEYKTEIYGKEADKIMAMENAMDMCYNQQKDLHQPVLWPNIALNLKFL